MPYKQTIKNSEVSDDKAITNMVERDIWRNITDITYPNGHTINFNRDALGHILDETEDIYYIRKINEYNYKKQGNE